MATDKIAQVISLPLPMLPGAGGHMPEFGDTFVIDDDEDGHEHHDHNDLEGFEDFMGLDSGTGGGEAPAEINIDNDGGDVTFNINVIPGAPADFVLDDEDDEDEEESEAPEEVHEDVDDWAWEKSHGTSKFIPWLKGMIDNIPSHSGSDTTGVERAIAYFERVNTEISRAMRKDFKNEIDASKAEDARSMITEGLERLNSRLQSLHHKKFKKPKKKADQEFDGIVKKADTSFDGNMAVNIPYFISFVARTCISASVQSGRDMSDTFIKLATEYKMDKREKVQTIQLIKDMGYPLIIDRIRINEGKLELKDHDGEFLAQFPA